MRIKVDQQDVTFVVNRPAIVKCYPSYAIEVMDNISEGSKTKAQVSISFQERSIFGEESEEGFTKKPILVINVYDENGKELSKTEIPLEDLTPDVQKKKQEYLKILSGEYGEEWK